MGPGGGAIPRQGSLTEQPNRPGANEKDAENLRAAERETELLESPIANLKEIIVIRGGKIILFHP
jgi:hypothetical protein